jgi:hypothetical protein
LVVFPEPCCFFRVADEAVHTDFHPYYGSFAEVATDAEAAAARIPAA